ncbi:MAG: hypothetical protein HY665_10060 [Chloroflexi bacterium]|nr:hypothetical protein [Chloroflexota bacterium]
MGKRIVIGILAVTGLVGALSLVLYFLGTLIPGSEVIGGLERVRLITPTGEVEVVAKIDTGADFSSIDEGLIASLGFTPNRQETKTITTESGTFERPTLRFKYILGNREISTQATVADRTAFNTVMLIGKADLQGFVIDASREFMASPRRQALLPFFGQIGFAGDRLGRIIIMIPILAAVVVLLRLLVGVRTYGVFAPTIIAITLLDLSIFSGIILYLFLIAVGISIKILVLGRLRLALVAELSLIMFTLVVLMAGMSLLPSGFSVPLGSAFFPLIITTHLIEQAARGIEEHSVPEVLFLLMSTFVTALILAGLGQILVQLSPTALWITFGGFMLASIVAGNYLGLRFTELIRFKFLRRTHVHK